MKKIIFYIAIVLFSTSCNYFTFKKESDKEALARVDNMYLYADDIKDLVIDNISSEDSTLIVRNFVNNWVKQQLLLKKAEINLLDKSAEFERLVKEYREDLFINSYKAAIISQELDTTITNYDLEQYYLVSNENFKLNEELIQLKYISFAKNISNKKELTKLFRSTKKEDLEALESKGLELNAVHLNDSLWVKLSDVFKTISVLKNEDKNQLLKKINFIQKEDSIDIYLISVKGVLKRNEIAPLNYITPTIKQIILHQRKLKLLKKIEETLLNDGKNNKLFEIY